MNRDRYRWAVLAAGTGAQAAFSTITLGLPVLAPALRDEYDLSLAQVGVVLAAEWVGLTLTLLPWGLAADRFGERRVLPAGLALCAACVAVAAAAPSFAWLVLLIGLAGAAGGSVQSGSGRAVMHWFDARERGLALGLRQTAVPIGGFVAALALPAVEAAGGVDAALVLLAVLCAAGAVAGAVVLRERTDGRSQTEARVSTLRDGRLWRVSFGSGLNLFAQFATLGFIVLFLHDARGFSTAAAGAVVAAGNVGGAALRIAVGRWSDTLGARIVPLRRVALAVFASLAAAAALLDAPSPVLVPVLVVATALSMAWNGLSFTAAAELAGERRSGAAIGFQQTVLSLIGILAPLAFAAAVDAISWRAAFALAALPSLVGWLWLRPLDERAIEARRAG